MCSTEISVSERETMGSRSNLYLIVLVTLSCVAFISVIIGLSLGGNEVYANSNGSIMPVSALTPLTIDLDNDVSVPQKCVKYDIDVEAGWIAVPHCDIPDLLPLCVTQADLDLWSMIFATCGGYEPDGGTAQLIQKDGCHGNININFVEVQLPAEDHCNLDCDCCEVKYYKAIFTLADGPICLDANHLPTQPEVDELGGFDTNCWITTGPDKTLQKEVDFVMWQDWKGCEEPDQSFEVILAHKSCIENLPRLFTHRQ